MRQIILLAVGLGIGIAGTVLFLQSAPPEPDSVEERAVKAEMELEKARKQIAGFEAVMGKRPGSLLRDTFSDRSRQIAEDIKAGRPVTVDDVFGTFKPVLRDLAPLFERMRLRDQREHFDTMAGQFSREYELNEAQEKALSEYLERKAEENAAEYFAVLTSDTSGFEEFVRASENFERDGGIDDFMERTLKGEKLEGYRADRMNQRLLSVQNEADRNVTRLDSIVGLDESQKDQMFEFMARGSRDFDPSMQFEGLTGDTGRLPPGQGRNQAILSVLRPDQKAKFDEHRSQQREEAEKDLRSIGLTLPADWDLFDEWDRDPPAIEVRDLRVDYGDFVAVDEISFTVPKGEVLGLVGPNGAGKTSTFRVLATLMEPTYGEVRIAGFDVLEDRESTRRVIGYMPDLAPVPSDLRIWEFLDFHADTHRLGSRAARRDRVDECLETVKLTDKRKAWCKSLSRGQMQRLVLAKTMLHRPRVLILDEPASGLDPLSRRELRLALQGLARDGATVFVSSHILGELDEMCSSLCIMNQGKLLASGTADEVRDTMGRSEHSLAITVLERAEETAGWLKFREGIHDLETDGLQIHCGFTGSDEDQAALLADLVAAGFAVKAFEEQSYSFEEILIEVAEGNRES